MRNSSSKLKKNVHRFNEDILENGNYTYTGERYSAKLANSRISKSIADSFDFRGKSVLDLGCGDGSYTLEFFSLGASIVIGMDPAKEAIEYARRKVKDLNLDNTVKFEVGNIYDLRNYLSKNQLFDCIVIRGVLHHLSDPKMAISQLSGFKGTIIIVEPNGNNPILKLLERFSQYHLDHEERSFRPSKICSWLKKSNLNVQSCSLINLVPFFCPDKMAQILKVLEPLVEKIPLLRNISCGQSVIVARK